MAGSWRRPLKMRDRSAGEKRKRFFGRNHASSFSRADSLLDNFVGQLVAIIRPRGKMLREQRADFCHRVNDRVGWRTVFQIARKLRADFLPERVAAFFVNAR